MTHETVQQKQNEIDKVQAELDKKLDNKVDGKFVVETVQGKSPEDFSNVLIGEVDDFQKDIMTSGMEDSRKEHMLNKVLGLLSGIDERNVENRTGRLAKKLDAFRKRGDFVGEPIEEEPAKVVTAVPKKSTEVVTEDIYTAKKRDTLTGIVKVEFGIDWSKNIQASLAVVRMLNDLRGPNADANEIKPGDELKIGAVRAKLVGGMPTAEQMAGAIEWYNGLPSTKPEWKVSEGGQSATRTATKDGDELVTKTVAKETDSGGSGEAKAEATAKAEVTVNVNGGDGSTTTKDNKTGGKEGGAEGGEKAAEKIDLTSVKVGDTLEKNVALANGVIEPGAEEDDIDFKIKKPAEWGWKNDDPNDFTVIKLPTKAEIDKIEPGTVIIESGAKELGIFEELGEGGTLLPKKGFAYRDSSSSEDVVKLPAGKENKSYVKDVEEFLNPGAFVVKADAENLGILKDGVLQDKWGFDGSKEWVIRLPDEPDKDGVTAVADLPAKIMIPVEYAKETLGLYGEVKDKLVSGWEADTTGKFIVKLSDASFEKKVYEAGDLVEEAVAIRDGILVARDPKADPVDYDIADGTKWAWIDIARDNYDVVKLPDDLVADAAKIPVRVLVELASAKALKICDENRKIIMAGWGLINGFYVKLPEIPNGNTYEQNKDSLQKKLPVMTFIPKAEAARLKIYELNNNNKLRNLERGWAFNGGDVYKLTDSDGNYSNAGGDEFVSKLPENTYILSKDADKLGLDVKQDGWGYFDGLKQSYAVKLGDKIDSVPDGVTVKISDPLAAGIVDIDGYLMVDGWKFSTYEGKVTRDLNVRDGVNKWVADTVKEYDMAWDKVKHPEGPFYIDEGSDVIEYAEDWGNDNDITKDVPTGVDKKILVGYLNYQWKLIHSNMPDD